MAQPSVAAFFNTRKRAAVEQIGRSSKVLLLNESETSHDALKNINNNETNLKVTLQSISERDFTIKRSKVTTRLKFDTAETMVSSPKVNKKSTPVITRSRKGSTDTKQHDISKLFQSIENKKDLSKMEIKEEILNDPLDDVPVGQYPSTPTKKQSTLEQINSTKDNLSLAEIKTKLTRSSRLAELKASIAKINKSAAKLEEIQTKTSKLETFDRSSLKSFDKIDLQITVSPRKAVSSPQKEYLSPTKSLLSSPIKSVSGLTTPTKQSKCGLSSPSKLAAYQRFASLTSTEKSALTLPFKYRCLAEVFRCLDSVCAMFFNRGEIITFKKIKPAVQELLRKNFTEIHLEQIKSIYPESYTYSQDKIRNFGSTSKQEKYQLILSPIFEDNLNAQSRMGSATLLERRRKLFNLLIEKVKDYHQEFLSSLEKPMEISRDKIVRWHPEFDIEKIPDVERSLLPQPPNIDTVSSAKDVLAKARNLFSCNTRMEKALERLSELQDKQISKEDNTEIKTESCENKTGGILKGVPKSLLDKIRARQAAKALEAMTRAPVKDKEAVKYAQLPDLAKYTRNIFISEKKSVLPIESIINKLNNSFRTSFTPSEIEDLLKLLCELLPGWIVFHEIRKSVFVKLSKDTDMTKVLNKLEKIAKDKVGD